MRRRGYDAEFCATGQTGVLIAGRGVAIDAVLADFISGAVEWMAPDAAEDHWQLVEGQGSLFHPSFAGVTLGLLHGAQPELFVVCHEPTRDDDARGDASPSLPCRSHRRDHEDGPAHQPRDPAARHRREHGGARQCRGGRLPEGNCGGVPACRRSTRSAPASGRWSTGWRRSREAMRLARTARVEAFRSPAVRDRARRAHRGQSRGGGGQRRRA